MTKRNQSPCAFALQTVKSTASCIALCVAGDVSVKTADSGQFPCEEPELARKSFLVGDINNTFSGADDDWIRSKTDIETIFEENDEVFHGFALKGIAAATANRNTLLME